MFAESSGQGEQGIDNQPATDAAKIAWGLIMVFDGSIFYDSDDGLLNVGLRHRMMQKSFTCLSALILTYA